jgi:poly(beta-D-mannuronate) C5 epimerase
MSGTQGHNGRMSPRSRLIALGAIGAAAVLALVIGALPSREVETRPVAAGSTDPAAVLPVTGGDYPVPPNALIVSPAGQDSAPGTAARPLRTVAAAVARAAAGATIVIHGGTYRETLGQLSKRLTIESYPGEQVWLKGSVVVTAWTRSGNLWRHDGWSSALCQTCFTPGIIDPAHPLAGSPDMAFLDGKPLRQVDQASAVQPGTFFVDRVAKALVLGDAPTGRTVEATKFDRLAQFDSAAAGGSVFRGIGVAQYGSNQDYGKHGAMLVVNAPNVTVDNTTFAWSASSGLAVFQPGGTVSGSSFSDNGLVGLVANRADGLRLTGDAFTANNQEHFALTGDAIGAAGAKVTRTKKPYIADNKFIGNIGTGWWCDLGCTDATVIRNLAKDNVVNGLYYEVSSRALIASNVLDGNGAHGLKLSSADQVRVYQNTFVSNALSLGLYNDKRSPDFDPYSAAAGLTWRTAGTVLVNNFYAQTETRNPVVESDDYKADAANDQAFVSTSDGNAYVRAKAGNAAPLLTWCGAGGESKEYGSLPDFSAATGSDTHGLAHELTTSPFKATSKNDYSLVPTAPGIAAGRPLPADVAAALGLHPVPNPSIGTLTPIR